MSGFDGKGPRGKGPMTGKAQGYCLLNMPDDFAEAENGFTGLQGKPFGQDAWPADWMLLRKQLRRMQMELDEMKSRLAELEAGGGK